MPSQDDIEAQQQLLTTHRDILHILLQKEIVFEVGHTPAHLIYEIQKNREKIKQIKQSLRAWGVGVEDLPNDEALTSTEDKATLPIQNRGRSVSRPLTFVVVLSTLVLIGVVIASAGLFSIWPFNSSHSTDDLLSRADNAVKNKDYESAISLYSEVLNNESYNIAALLGRGTAYYFQKNYDAAIADYSEVLIRTPSPDRQLRARESLGNCYDQIADYQHALDNYSAALNIARQKGDRSDEGRLLYEQGRTYAKLGDRDRSQQSLEQALAIAKAIKDRQLETRVTTTIYQLTSPTITIP